MWAIDFPSLAICILSALYLGWHGLSGQPLMLGNEDITHLVYALAGLSGIWQLLRQRFH